jgi:pyruvate dehydrogenase E2 component (dihydrolipoamide acetyltransferase)
MDFLMKMPDLSTTDSAIKILRWLVQPGQAVKRGQPLCEIETDKATSEVESIVTGVFKECRVQEGDMVTVGQEIALFETATAPSSVPSTAPGIAPDVAPAATPAPAKGAGLFARNRAPAAAKGFALSQTQQAVGRRMQASKQNIPHFYLQASANAEPLIRRRQALSPKPVWEAFFVSAIASVLQDFERIRWRLSEERVTLSPSTDVGVAVDMRGDLFVVPVAAPPGVSIEKISDEIRARVRGLQDGTETTAGIQPTAITITNLGDTRVESFAAIINPPEVAILAIGKIGPVPIVHEGTVIVQHRVELMLSADHRILNGRYAASFLDAIIREIESF